MFSKIDGNEFWFLVRVATLYVYNRFSPFFHFRMFKSPILVLSDDYESFQVDSPIIYCEWLIYKAITCQHFSEICTHQFANWTSYLLFNPSTNFVVHLFRGDLSTYSTWNIFLKQIEVFCEIYTTCGYVLLMGSFSSFFPPFCVQWVIKKFVFIPPLRVISLIWNDVIYVRKYSIRNQRINFTVRLWFITVEKM